MLKIYRIKTESRKHFMGGLEWQYIKEELTCFRYCPIQDRFIVIGWRWAGNSMFGFSTAEAAREWGYKSLCKQKQEFVLIGR